MNQQWRWWVFGGAVVLVLLLTQHDVWGAASTGSGFYLEETGVKIFTLCKNVLVPLLLLGMVVFAGANVAFGFVQMGPGLTRLFLGAAIIAGGIETILLIVGGTVNTAMMLP